MFRPRDLTVHRWKSSAVIELRIRSGLRFRLSALSLISNVELLS